jgi:RNA polymerase sigma-70 factor, ECF subfamily
MSFLLHSKLWLPLAARRWPTSRERYFLSGLTIYGVMTEVARCKLGSRYERVYRFVRRRTNSDEAAEDLTQQAFVEAATSGERGGDLGLLFTIAKRRVIDERRKPKQFLVPLERAEAMPAREESRDVARAVSEAIERLESRERQLIVLKLLRGLSFAEVSQIIGVSEGACKMRFRRVLERLRTDLEEKGIQP